MKNESESKRRLIHDFLKAGYKLSKLQCIEKFRYINLGDYIYILRKKYGYDYIKTEKVFNYETGTEFAVYSIDDKYLCN